MSKKDKMNKAANKKAKQEATDLKSSRYNSEEYGRMSDGMVP